MRLYALLTLLISVSVLAADDNIATLRGADIATEVEPPRMAQVENKDIKRQRNYPMQPPTIPHKIDSYYIDLNSNKCLSCHSRRRIEESQAPMVSITHYMDRDGNFLAEISPRRYFCNQCHVTQEEVKPLVDNTFQDIDEILKTKKQSTNNN